ELAAEELVVLFRAGLFRIDVLEPVGRRLRVSRAEGHWWLALGLDIGEQLREAGEVAGGRDAKRLVLVRSGPRGALAVALHHDGVLRRVDLTDLEDSGWVVGLQRVHVDANVGDLLEGSLPRELAQEPDARHDRDVRRIAAGDARLKDRRIVITDGFVVSSDARLRIEGVEIILERCLLAPAPDRCDDASVAGCDGS